MFEIVTERTFKISKINQATGIYLIGIGTYEIVKQKRKKNTK